MSDRPTPGHEHDLVYEQPPAAGACGPSAGVDAHHHSIRQISDLQMALRVVYELIDGGPGNAGQLAERMTEKDDDGCEFTEGHVDAGLAELDRYSLLEYPSLDDGAPVCLRVPERATNPRPQAPGAKPSEQDPVDWRARSQVLEEALRPFADIFERYEQVHDLDANEVVVPYVALFNAHKHLEAARDALSLGLPDEEGEEQTAEDYGASPSGAARKGSDVGGSAS